MGDGRASAGRSLVPKGPFCERTAMKLRTRYTTGGAVLVGLALTLSACGPSSGGPVPSGSSAGVSQPVTITFYSTASEDAAMQRYKDVVAAFEKAHPDVHVEVTFPGSEYENLLKTKMAANDLPDVFQTHGWTRDRYQPYLLGLSEIRQLARVSDSQPAPKKFRAVSA